MKRLILIDGNALVHRAFHALPPLKAPDGMISNAVFGFSSILIKTIQDLKPDYIAAAFDLAAPTFRHEEYEDYKAHREKAPNELYLQMPKVKEILKAFGVPLYEQEGYEADDLIGTLATRASKEKDLEVFILTGDLDALQLVEDRKVMVYTLKRGVTDTVIYDEEAVKERYGGLTPEKLKDYKGLKGDPSDNIPGVAGVGDKTAISLITEFGSIENMYKYLEENEEPTKTVSLKLREKLLNGKDQAIFSKRLATIVTDMDISFSLEGCDWKEKFKPDQIESLFRELAFTSLIKRAGELRELKQRGFGFEETKEDETKTSNVKIEEANSELPKEILVAKEVFVNYIEDNFLLTTGNGKIYKTNNILLIGALFNDKNIFKIGHDIKNLVKVILKENIEINNIYDIAIGAYLIAPDQKKYSFENIYFQEFQKSPDQDPEQQILQLKELKNRIWEKMKNMNVISVFEDIEMPVLPILGEMELEGIKVDKDVLANLKVQADKEIKKLEEKIYNLVGAEFNINSPQQLASILYDKLEIPGRIRKTSGGARSTAAPELEKIVEKHPVIDFILQYRELQKLRSTYIEPFPELINEDGRIHTTYNQMGTGTGRLSSENPNLQNIPVRTELGREFRISFIPEDGYDLVSFDYSQLELRVVAHISEDQTMIEAFKKGEDIHTRTAAEIFDVTPENVTEEMRRQAKVINFGVLYGMGVLGFSRRIGVKRDQAKAFIEKYFEEFSGVKDYIDRIKEEIRKNSFVETIFGRRRQINEVFATIPSVARQGERMAVNFPIQGTAADIMKMAMIEVSKKVKEEFSDKARMLLQVHDELVFEVKKEATKDFIREIKKIMEESAELSVPLIVDAKIGSNWAEMEKI